MADLALRTQGLLQGLLDALNSLPFWLALGILFAPTLLSLLTWQWITIVATALLNIACLVLLAAGQNLGIAGPLMIVTFAASLTSALFGFHAHQLWQKLSDLDARVTYIEEQMMTFLRALEARSAIIDQRAEGVRKAFEKVPTTPYATAAHTLTPTQGLRTSAPESPKAVEPQPTAILTNAKPPEPKA